MNNELLKFPNISNLEELNEITNKILKLEEEKNKLSLDESLDKLTKKIEIIKINETITDLQGKLLRGIPVNCNNLNIEIQKNIILYLKKYGYDEDFILNKLKNIEFYITNERLLSGGLLGTYSNKVSIDYSLVEFDSNGTFLRFKNEDFIKYVLTHEYMHILSDSSKNFVQGDALSEGFTEFFAHSITNNYSDKSLLYDFSLKVCTLLLHMIGEEKVLNDYLINITTFPNLKILFSECGLDENSFKIFHVELNDVLKKQFNNENNNELFFQKQNMVSNLKTLVIEYLNQIENKEYYINLFNNLFSEFDITLSLSEIKSQQK